jgi:hypothetical protein
VVATRLSAILLFKKIPCKQLFQGIANLHAVLHTLNYYQNHKKFAMQTLPSSLERSAISETSGGKLAIFSLTCASLDAEFSRS